MYFNDTVSTKASELILDTISVNWQVREYVIESEVTSQE